MSMSDAFRAEERPYATCLSADHERLTAGVRYDRFDPNTARANTQWAVTPYVNIPLNNGFQLIAEYQRRNFQLDATHDRQNDTFQVRVIFIQ